MNRTNPTLQEVKQQSFNLMGVAVLTLTALTLISVVFIEDEWLDRLDDIAVILLALIGVLWYLRGQNRFKLSATMLLLNGLAFLTHVVAIFIERDDPKAFGDNVLTIQYYLFATVFLGWQYYRLRKDAKLNDSAASNRSS